MLLAATTTETDVLTDIEAAYDYLVELDQVDPDHIGLVGFSLGGGLALDYAVQHPEIGAAVNLYGDVITDPDILRGSGPIMGIFPAEGTNFPVEDFEAALEAAGVTYEVNLSEGVGPDFVSFPTVTINNTAASEAFDDMLDFLDTALKPE
jgi:carboxymethylenebutenolidase